MVDGKVVRTCFMVEASIYTIAILGIEAAFTSMAAGTCSFEELSKPQGLSPQAEVLIFTALVAVGQEFKIVNIAATAIITVAAATIIIGD